MVENQFFEKIKKIYSTIVVNLSHLDLLLLLVVLAILPLPWQDRDRIIGR